MFNPIKNFVESFKDNVLRDMVQPKIGSIVKCDLLAFEHTGIYIGNGQIIHRDGDGMLGVVYHDEFLNRLDGFNSAISVYVSCSGKKPFGKKSYAERARNFLDDPNFAGYSLIAKNCHNFTYACMTGKFDDEQKLINCTFLSIEEYLGKHVDDFNWRVWDYKPGKDEPRSWNL